MEEQPIRGGRIAPGGTSYTTTVDRSMHVSSSRHNGDNLTIITNNNSTSSKRPEDRHWLGDHVSHEALHDSAERSPHAPKCYPGTRVNLRHHIIGWVEHGEHRDTSLNNSGNHETTATSVQHPEILWLTGPAGTGKTAIMGTIADDCHREGLLAASFFFSSDGGDSQGSKTHFVSTLVYQLIQHKSIVGLREEVLSALDRDPLILKKNLEAQVDGLILLPLRNVAKKSDPCSWPSLVLVDGVDECRNGSNDNDVGMADSTPMSQDDTYREILSALVHASNDASFPFRIIIASRPERAIKRYLNSLPPGSIKRIFLDDEHRPQADIELYARAMLRTIGQDLGLSERWYNEVFPTDRPKAREDWDVPRYLAKKSSGHFVYISVVMRFIRSNTRAGLPQHRLGQVLSWKSDSTSNPFADLDKLYTEILHTSPEPSQAALLICASETKWKPGWYAHVFQEASPGYMAHVLGPLTSLVRIVGSDGKPDFQNYHKSLRDFLWDQGRAGNLHVEGKQVEDLENRRFHAIVKNRGPHVPLSTGRGSDLDRFFEFFEHDFHNRFESSPKYRFTIEDVDWWIATISRDIGKMPLLYHRVHRRCQPWHACRQVCQVWRKGILRYARANGWRVPTMLETVQDRIQPLPYIAATGELAINRILCPPDQDDPIKGPSIPYVFSRCLEFVWLSLASLVIETIQDRIQPLPYSTATGELAINRTLCPQQRGGRMRVPSIFGYEGGPGSNTQLRVFLVSFQVNLDNGTMAAFALSVIFLLLACVCCQCK